MTDEELIEQYYHGDAKALALIFQRHKNGMFNFALRILLNRADAEDVISEVFGRLCEPRHQFTIQAKFKTWLYTIVRNACVDKIRSRRKWTTMWFQNKDSQEFSLMDFSSEAPNAADHLLNKEAIFYIQSAINKLPGDQKEALILREYENLSYEEIAQVIGCSLSNVKILIYRARTALKEHIPAYIKEGR